MSPREPASAVSVITLVRGRERHLANLIEGLNRQDRLPAELVIAVMQDDAPDTDTAAFPVRIVHVPGDPMPLAAARNAGGAAASGDILVFLDVDCIPAPDLTQTYADAVMAHGGCHMGEVRYLSYLPEPGYTYEALQSDGERHPSKPPAPEGGSVPQRDYGELWGLSFALSASDFSRTGGFDERFYGYGGEETDFARALDAADVPLFRVANALAFHQVHDIRRPPFHHLADIVRNAGLFREKWGDWCMDYWLGQFAERGLIDWSADADAIDVRRLPSAAEIEAAKAPPGTRYS